MKNFDAWTHNQQWSHIICNILDDDIDMDDIWRCGWIYFEWTWNETVLRKKKMFVVIYDDEEKHSQEKTNHEFLETKIKTKAKTVDKNRRFGIFQVRVSVDTTEEYNKHDDLIQKAIAKNATRQMDNIICISH